MGWTAAGVAIAAIGAGASTYEAEQGRKVQKRGLQEQQKAQEQAESAAARQQREAAEAVAKAKRPRPSVSGLLSDTGRGVGSTLLTGSLGIDSSLLSLGKSSLLGG